MRFTAWMWEQMEDDFTPIGDFCRTCWEDVNNGCASSLFTVYQWKAHFEERHKYKSTQLISLLTMAYAHYILSTSEK